jgi:hypothetical protein
MDPERWRRITAVFHAARSRDPAQRGAFLDEACGVDADVRAQVERLLAADHEAGHFGEVPVVADLGDAPSGEAAPSRSSPPSGANAHEAAAAPQAPSVRRLRHPFTWLVLLAAAASAMAFGHAAWRLVQNGGRTPSFGWGEARRAGAWFVARVDPAGPASGQLQPGDGLINFDGGPLHVRAGTTPYRNTLSVGDSYRLTIMRQGERLEVELPVLPGPSRLATWLAYFFGSLVWCAVGLFIGLARPDQAVARLASAASVTTGLNFLNAGVLFGGPLFNPMHVVLGYHFFCRFPTGRPVNGIWRIGLLLLYGAGAIPFLLGLWLRGTLVAGGIAGGAELVNAHQLLFQLRGPLAAYVLYGALALMFAVVVRNYRQLAGEDQRRRVRWVLLGSIIALTPQAVRSGGGLLFGPGAVAWLAVPANLFPVAIPLVVAYAVVRHRVFDIRIVIRRGVQYLLARRVLRAAVALPIGALIYTVARHRGLTIAQLVGDTRAYLVWLAAAGLMLRFRGPLRRSLDRRFFRAEYDREQLLLGLLEDVRKADSVTELAQVISDRLTSTLHLATAYVWYRDPDELTIASSSDPQLIPADIPSRGPWLAWLEQQGEASVFPLPAQAGLSAREARWFGDRGIRLIVPIMDSAERLVGALLLGEKQSEEPYGAHDARLLSAIARQAAVVRENLRLRARVGEEVRVKHDVLARLDRRAADLLKECPRCSACFDGAVERCPADGQLLALSLPVPRIIDRKYRLDRLIGKGGMGAVYEAHDLRLDRAVAIKILLGRAFGQQAALRRFHREARATARLNHPNIVAMYDYGSLEGEGAYLVLERVHGVTLRTELERRKSLPPAVAAEWFEPLLGGIAAAHAAGLVHRDLKPENVMGRRTASGTLAVKVLDLGLVKFQTLDSPANVSTTGQGVVMGTPGYMAPEQLLGREVDHRTDIFALAVMLLETLTGERPPLNQGSTTPQSALLPGSGTPGDPAPQVRALEGLLRRCLAWHSRDRYPSIDALREELIPALRACPPLAPAGESTGV